MCAGRNAYFAAFLEMAGLTPKNILLFEIADTFYDVALMLVLDDETRAIVIIVRGTLSGDDTLCDLLAIGEPVRETDEKLPEGQRYLGHGGMVRVARRVCKKIIKERWVENARKLRPDYPVVICGHSLGAGLVSLIEQCSDSTRDYLVSVIYGYDMVGRLGAATLEDLKARLFHALCVCNVPKFKMLGSRMSICLFNKFCPCSKTAPLG
ncbi:unnamed protein product, partial [Dibothriocephalus latus]